MPRLWAATLSRLVVGLLAGALVGWLYGRPFPGMLAVALAFLGWHLWHLYRLERWLLGGRDVEMPEGGGPWPAVFAKIQFMRGKAKRRGKRFRRLVKELRASTEAFPDGGVILNSQHEIRNFNQAAQQLLGLKGRRDRGQRIEHLFRHPEFIAYLENPDGRMSVEVPSPVSGDIWLLCRLVPYGPDQNLLLVRDISQRVKIERVRRDFVANASHELRSPLTVISGYLDSMGDEDDLPERWRQPVATMQRQAQRMQHLVEDLLKLSRLESGAPVTKERVVDVNSLLAAARKEVLALPSHPATVKVELLSDARLLGEEVELQSIVSNLVSNAARYTPADGSITIRWQVDERGGHLSVTDTGIGIPAEDIPRVTERFYRADGGRARERGGTGLGLAIVKHALRRHDAELSIDSQPGKGSTFTCHFPPDRLAAA